MLDGLDGIQARVEEIQSRLASLSRPALAPPTTLPQPGAAQTPPFAQVLEEAQTAPQPPVLGEPEGKALSFPVPPELGTRGRSARALTELDHPIHGPTQLPDAVRGVRVPPASLGPLPPMPVSLAPMPVAPVRRADSNGDYEPLIQTYAQKHGLAPALVRAVIRTESDGNTHCVSRAGAMGLMQLMPDNVKEAGIHDPFDPEQNISAGTRQLSDLMQKYGGDLDLTLAAYNAGPGNVHKYGGVPPFTETRNYIRKVRAAMDDK